MVVTCSRVSHYDSFQIQYTYQFAILLSRGGRFEVFESSEICMPSATIPEQTVERGVAEPRVNEQDSRVAQYYRCDRILPTTMLELCLKYCLPFFFFMFIKI